MRVLTERRNEISLVRIEGEIDPESTPWLLDTVLDALAAAAAVELDLRAVTFIDSSGLEVLRRAEDEATRADRHLVVRRSAVVCRAERLANGIAHAHG